MVRGYVGVGTRYPSPSFVSLETVEREVVKVKIVDSLSKDLCHGIHDKLLRERERERGRRRERETGKVGRRRRGEEGRREGEEEEER